MNIDEIKKQQHVIKVKAAKQVLQSMKEDMEILDSIGLKEVSNYLENAIISITQQHSLPELRQHQPK